MMELLEDIRRIQGLEEKRKGTLLPRAVLVIAAVALVAVMIMRFQYKYERTERNEASHFQPAVLVKKLSDTSDPTPATHRAAADAEKNAAPQGEALAKTNADSRPEGLAREDAFRPGPPEQPDLEKVIDMLIQRRSPKY